MVKVAPVPEREAVLVPPGVVPADRVAPAVYRKNPGV
jgi:hypothetical protein